MKLKVWDIKGKETSATVELSDAVFGIEPSDHAIWLDIRSIRANQRQGTHASKNRALVAGGGKKPFRQKGTGRARQGTIRAPHHVGGGRVFGPEPRIYSVGINKKVKLLARKSALSYKAKNKSVFVVEDFKYDKISTSDFQELLKNLSLGNNKILFLTADYDPNIYKSAKNLYNVNVLESLSFSTYDVLNAEKLIVQKSAVEKVNEVLGK